MRHGPIFDAVRAFDVEALRREIAAGVDPDMLQAEVQATHHCIYGVFGTGRAPWEQIQERLECISVLLEAGASVDTLVCGATPLYLIPLREASPQHTASEHRISALVEAGANVNWAHTPGRISVLTMAAAE